jgi:two-component system, NtrC family, sensor kinase
MYSYIPVSVPDGRAGAIEISESLSDEYHYIRQTVLTASLTALALVVLCAILAWVLGSRLIGQPIAVLVRQARRVGAGDLSGRLKLERKDEIGQLALEMDRMCDGLESAGARVQSETRARLAALEQLRHADRLTTVGTLASGVAHELGTPLNVIAGHAELLREDPGTSPNALENLSVISRQCARMTQIIRQLLDFSRRGLSSGTVSDVRVVALETLRMVDPLARARRIEIAFESGNEPSMAKIGFEPMQQVLTNVVLNGLQAMPNGGRLRVVLAREPQTDAGDPEYVRIDVKDSGPGMDEVTRKRVFEPFFTTKEVGEGTGLGLSVAHGIVEDHRGRIDVVSEIGSGTEFLIRVPAGSA